MDIENKITCKKCMLEIGADHINAEGECMFCVMYGHKRANRDYAKSEEKVRSVFNYYKEKYKDAEYDCLVPVSGGKDSVYVLYLAVKKFGLRPLALTYNNGLQTELARENIRKAADAIGVDHLSYSPNINNLKRLYRELFLKTKNICAACNHAINTTIAKTAAKEGIELVLLGGVGKLETAPIYGSRRYCMEDIFVKILSDVVPNPLINKFCNKEVRRNNPITPVSIFNYVDYDYRTVLKTLKTELNWKEAPHGDAKIDCLFYPVISYFKYLQNGITSSMLGASSLLRDGQISAGEFQARVEKEKHSLADFDKEKIKEFFDFLGVDESGLENDVHILDYAGPPLSDESFEPLRAMKKSGATEEELLRKLIDIIRPDIQRDGGDIEIAGYENKVLAVRLKGGCKGCMQVDDTMIPYIESLTAFFISELISVENDPFPNLLFSNADKI